MKFFTLAGQESSRYFLKKKLRLWRVSVLNRVVMSFLFLGMFIPPALAADPVTGRVTDDKGNPLPGVTVQVKGKEVAVTTDGNGKYTIEVPSDTATLIFSYVGFTPLEVIVSGKKAIDITLQPESKALGDVVVVGYGRQKKVNLVGAVSAVTVDDKITSRALPNISSGLEGLVPGLPLHKILVWREEMGQVF